MMKAQIAIMGILCMAVAVHAAPNGIGFGNGQSLDPRDALKALDQSTPPALKGSPTGGNQPNNKPSRREIEWVTIPGGKFMMGTDEGGIVFKSAKPVHEVTIRTFQMSKTRVTVEQYAECVAEGSCTEPATGQECNWGKTGREQHPINCVWWYQAHSYAHFKGARLPTEAEWEYAAASGGKNQKYPWGNEAPTCERVVALGCGTPEIRHRTRPELSDDGKKCAREKGETAQGLCDMSGNTWQWVEDRYHGSYVGAPADGTAYRGGGDGDSLDMVIRGGSFIDNGEDLRVHRRSTPGGYFPDSNVGFRLARNLSR